MQTSCHHILLYHDNVLQYGQVLRFFLTQGPADAGDAVGEGLAGPLDVEGHPVPEAAHEADVGLLQVQDHHVSSHRTVAGVALQHFAQLQCGQSIQLGVRITHLGGAGRETLVRRRNNERESGFYRVVSIGLKCAIVLFALTLSILGKDEFGQILRKRNLTCM